MALEDPVQAKKAILDTSVKIAIRLSIIAGLAVWCFIIMRPFVLPMISGMIIAVALAKPFGKFAALVGGRRGLAAGLFVITAIVIVVVPAFKVADSVVHSSLALADQLEAETLQIPPANESVRAWPVIGDRVYDAWSLASTNLDDAIARFTPQIKRLGAWVLAKVSGLLGALAHGILALIISAFMLTFAEGGAKAARSIMKRFGGARGAGMVDTIAGTINSVALGVLGIAVVQAAMGGLGMFLVGVPGWGVWTVLILVLAVMQLPPLVVLGPVIVWAFGALDSTAITLVFTGWSLFVSISDTFLKPLFLGRGLSIPMPVILIGAIGGLIAYGLVGLFVGAVVLAIGYELFQAWMVGEGASAPDAEALVTG